MNHNLKAGLCLSLILSLLLSLAVSSFAAGSYPKKLHNDACEGSWLYSYNWSAGSADITPTTDISDYFDYTLNSYTYPFLPNYDPSFQAITEFCSDPILVFGLCDPVRDGDLTSISIAEKSGRHTYRFKTEGSGEVKTCIRDNVVYTFTYDQHGDLTQVHSGGKVIFRATYQNGRIKTIMRDLPSYGSKYEFTFDYYDADGRVLHGTTSTPNGRGEVDVLYTMSEGYPLHLTYLDPYRDNTGVTVKETDYHFHYDRNERMTSADVVLQYNTASGTTLRRGDYSCTITR